MLSLLLTHFQNVLKLKRWDQVSSGLMFYLAILTDLIIQWYENSQLKTVLVKTDLYT